MANNDLGKVLKQRRLMMPLTLNELSARSGVSASHLGRIEGGDRFPSAHILGKIAKPLEFDESELLTLAGYLSAQPSSETGEEYRLYKQLDPYVARVLSEEPVGVQRAVIAILSILKNIAVVPLSNVEFAEYAHRKYPGLDDDVITMIEDIIKGGKP